MGPNDPALPSERHGIVFFVDDVKLETTERKLNGATIKKLAGRPENYQLFCEHPGHPDQLIADDQLVELKEGEHFHTVPPAQFG